ncbi:MAG: nicotinamidase [Phycisphaerales bacterium]
MTPQFKVGDALLIVDVQNDFCPGGALPVPNGDTVVAVLNEWIAAALWANVPVYASRDWHPSDHLSFTDQGGPWPVHCVQDTPGAAFRSDLQLPHDAVIVSKGTDPADEAYSVFGNTDLAERLQQANVKRLRVGGLALDYCVRASVLDALKEGFAVHLIADATRAVNLEPSDGDKALDEMREAGVIVEGMTP